MRSEACRASRRQRMRARTQEAGEGVGAAVGRDEHHLEGGVAARLRCAVRFGQLLRKRAALLAPAAVRAVALRVRHACVRAACCVRAARAPACGEEEADVLARQRVRCAQRFEALHLAVAVRHQGGAQQVSQCAHGARGAAFCYGEC
jgi:hypothetical protein